MNPLILVAIAAFLILVSLLLVFKKKKQRLFLFGILLVMGAIAGWYGYKEFTRTNKDLSAIKSDIIIAATSLIYEYETNDSLANKKYLGKIIEATGVIKDIKKDEAGYYTVVLGDTLSMSSVRCSMDSTHQDAAKLEIGSSATVRGSCTGFNKDEMGLGSDVILNRCVIVQNKN